jgi:hypothetical protein
VRSYERLTSRESKPGQFRDFTFRVPGKKCHSDASATVKCKEYYMGEGGGFPLVRAVVSQVSPRLPLACPSTKGVLECELTNLLVGLMQVRVSE